jgi:hypothetical protein
MPVPAYFHSNFALVLGLADCSRKYLSSTFTLPAGTHVHALVRSVDTTVPPTARDHNRCLSHAWADAAGGPGGPWPTQKFGKHLTTPDLIGPIKHAVEGRPVCWAHALKRNVKNGVFRFRTRASGMGEQSLPLSYCSRDVKYCASALFIHCYARDLKENRVRLRSRWFWYLPVAFGCSFISIKSSFPTCIYL